MSMWRRPTAGILALCFLGLAACAPMQTNNSDLREKTLSALRSGTISLDCGVPCAWAWVNEKDRIRAFDAAGDWEELALRVAQVGYQKDLAYYYLGRAAEGLGYREAALAYYRDSYTLATGSKPGPQCRQVAGGCMGVDLLAVLPGKLRIASGPDTPEMNRGSIKQARNADKTQRQGSSPGEQNAPPGREESAHSSLTHKPLTPITRNIVDNITMQLGENEKYAVIWSLHSGEAANTDPELGSSSAHIRLRAYGDLNGDGVADAGVLVNQEGPGNQVSVYLVGVLAASGSPHITNSQYIETRGRGAAIKSLQIKNQRILINAVVVGPHDLPCCPTKRIMLTYAVKNGKLVRAPD